MSVGCHISVLGPQQGILGDPGAVENNLVHYSVLFNCAHIRRWDQCAVFILYSKISTDPGLLKIRHSHRFVAVVIQILIPFVLQLVGPGKV